MRMRGQFFLASILLLPLLVSVRLSQCDEYNNGCELRETICKIAVNDTI